MDRKKMEKRIRALLRFVKEEEFENLIWCVQQYAAAGMNEKRQA